MSFCAYSVSLQYLARCTPTTSLLKQTEINTLGLGRSSRKHLSLSFDLVSNLSNVVGSEIDLRLIVDNSGPHG